MIALVFAMGLAISTAGAQSPEPGIQSLPEVASEQWQAVITGQVAAFRAGEDGQALSFAARSFQSAYADPEEFVAAIRFGGYGPILDSKSHVFGEFRFNGTDRVVQTVTFFAPGQLAFEAVYQLGLEGSGWRIEMVILQAGTGVGV
ncbi:MAG: DUF4864 domain-containing protein [Alphaproteobacteria bacterium]|nr:DUF4864 domain-containing protein [Alphaproteobacteria bacterium]